jgi:hypothetical protein
LAPLAIGLKETKLLVFDGNIWISEIDRYKHINHTFSGILGNSLEEESEQIQKPAHISCGFDVK